MTTFQLLAGKQKPQFLAVDSVAFSSSQPHTASVHIQVSLVSS